MHSSVQRLYKRSAIVGMFVVTPAAWGVGTLASANTLVQNILTVLQGVSVAIVTIAVMWVGYKMIFQQARWSEVASIIIGALFIGAASSIASWLMGGP